MDDPLSMLVATARGALNLATFADPTVRPTFREIVRLARQPDSLLLASTHDSSSSSAHGDVTLELRSALVEALRDCVDQLAARSSTRGDAVARLARALDAFERSLDTAQREPREPMQPAVRVGPEARP